MPFEKTKQHPTMDSTFLCLKVFPADSRLWTAVRVNFANVQNTQLPTRGH